MSGSANSPRSGKTGGCPGDVQSTTETEPAGAPRAGRHPYVTENIVYSQHKDLVSEHIATRFDDPPTWPNRWESMGFPYRLHWRPFHSVEEAMAGTAEAAIHQAAMRWDWQGLYEVARAGVSLTTKWPTYYETVTGKRFVWNA